MADRTRGSLERPPRVKHIGIILSRSEATCISDAVTCTTNTFKLLTLLKQNVKQEREKAEISIQERSIFSSYYVFKRELEEQGLLTDTEAKILNEWFRYMTGGELGEFGADLIIYLRTDPKVALDRVRTRDRKEERNITLEKMENLHKYYEDWLIGQVNKKNPNKLWIVDANKPQREMEVEFRQMWKLIERKLKDMESGGV